MVEETDSKPASVIWHHHGTVHRRSVDRTFPSVQRPLHRFCLLHLLETKLIQRRAGWSSACLASLQVSPFSGIESMCTGQTPQGLQRTTTVLRTRKSVDDGVLRSLKKVRMDLPQKRNSTPRSPRLFGHVDLSVGQRFNSRNVIERRMAWCMCRSRARSPSASHQRSGKTSLVRRRIISVQDIRCLDVLRRITGYDVLLLLKRRLVPDRLSVARHLLFDPRPPLGPGCHR